MIESSRLLRHPVTGIVLCVLAAIFLLLYPLYVIRPFRYQGGHELLVALAVLRIRPWLSIVVAVAAATLLVLHWRLSRTRIGRIGVAAGTLLVILCAALCRVNVYELMFNPLDRIRTSPAATAKLDSDEEVIAIKVGSAARAYPIRSMSYHHIVNDTLAGEPIVATY